MKDSDDMTEQLPLFDPDNPPGIDIDDPGEENGPAEPVQLTLWEQQKPDKTPSKQNGKRATSYANRQYHPTPDHRPDQAQKPLPIEQKKAAGPRKARPAARIRQNAACNEKYACLEQAQL